MGKLINNSWNRLSGNGYIHNKGKILFLSQPLFQDEKEVDTLDYFCQMLASISIHLKEINDYDFVVKIPKSIDCWTEQIDFLQECIDNPYEYEAIIISPYDRFRILDHIIKLLTVNKKIKIFTIDKGYKDKEFPEFKKNGVDPPKFVKADWVNGGEIAAKAFKEFIEKKYDPTEASNCQILIVHGNDCHERENSFEEMIHRYSCDSCDFSAITHKINGDFIREKAYFRFKEWVELNKTNINNKPLYGVFSCNDEMALGIRQGIKDLENDYFQDYTPIIIGFDGIRDVTLLINEEDKFIYGTVNIKVDKQVKELITLIKKSFLNISTGELNELECEILKQNRI